MLTIFIAIANVFVNSGFNAALIRKKNRNEKDYATTFYFSIIMSVICYSLLFIFAPIISDFYNQIELINLTRFIALTTVINAFSIIPRTKLTVSLNFKNQAKANLTAIIVSGSIGLTLVFNGYGVWSLIVQQLTNATINVIMLNLLSPWKPTESFCKHAFKELFGFGSKLLASGLIDTIYNNIYGLIIGKQFSAMQLGIFNQAHNLSSMPATIITGVIQKVTYPMLSNIQDEEGRLDKAYLMVLKIAALTIFPIMLGIGIISEPMIMLLLGKEWKDSAPLISILTFGLMIYPIHAVNLNMLQVKGRSDLFLKLEIIKKLIITVALFITVPMGITEICIAIVVTSYIAIFINTYYTGKLSSISQSTQIKTISPIAISAIISASLGYYLGNGYESKVLSIATMLITSLAIYLVMLFIFQKISIK
ncbi:lipopolysaccharide biosynthesis protein [Vibrio cyclitrophicus]|uniref:lipopolysaccharide biosynthesis protein n=1 Tax=Vibrio cyclitrophicus TaxID=47951 RepID=UPI00399B5F0A